MLASKLSVCLTLLFALPVSLQSQTVVHRSDEVKGMSGTAKIIPNTAGRQTTVAFTSNVPLTPTSSQIVFLLLQEGETTAPAWAGNARILTGDGFVAVVPEDAGIDKWLFKFSDRGVPSRLTDRNFQVFAVDGIARYGETKPLTDQEIANLAATGSCGSPLSMKTKESH